MLLLIVTIRASAGGIRISPWQPSRMRNQSLFRRFSRRSFKELRNTLGLCDYQVLRRHAIERHLHLSGMAHLLLTHHGLQAAGAQAKQKDKDVSLPPMNERLENLRKSIRHDQTNALLKRIKNRQARATIREFLNECQIAA